MSTISPVTTAFSGEPAPGGGVFARGSGGGDGEFGMAGGDLHGRRGRGRREDKLHGRLRGRRAVPPMDYQHGCGGNDGEVQRGHGKDGRRAGPDPLRAGDANTLPDRGRRGEHAIHRSLPAPSARENHLSV